MINFYRGRRGESVLLESTFSESAESKPMPSIPTLPLPSDFFEAAEFRDILKQCMQKLKHLACRAVLALWLEGYKLRQIAEMLGFRPGTVNSHLARGRSFVKKCVQEQYA